MRWGSWCALFLLSTAAQAQHIYWADNGTDSLWRSAPDGSAPLELVTGGMTCPADVELDLGAGKLYWIDGSTGNLERSDLVGTGRELLVSGLSTASGLGLDLPGGKLYFTDLGTDRIARTNLDGTMLEVLVTGLSVPDGIQVDSAGGKFYWCDRGTNRVQRANLDGTSVEDLITAGLDEPDDIKLDLAAGKLYFSDYTLQAIRRANLDGTSIETIVSGVGFPRGLDLDLFEGKLYWGDPWQNVMRRSDLDGSHLEDITAVGLSEPLGVALDIGTGCRFVAPAEGALVSGTVDLTFTAGDRTLPTLTVAIEWSTDGGASWNAATPAPGSPLANPEPAALLPLPAPTFSWDSNADSVGAGGPQSVEVRVALAGTHPARCALTFLVVNSGCGGLCGDCDGNGTLSILDALCVARIAAGLVVATPQQLACADVDSTGALTIIDGLRIAQTSAGLPVVLVCT